MMGTHNEQGRCHWGRQTIPDGQRDISLKCQMVINIVKKAKVGKDDGAWLGRGSEEKMQG